MKLAVLFCLLVVPFGASAQKFEHDVIVHEAPAGYKLGKSGANLTYSIEDSKTGFFCILTLVRSQESKGSSKENLKSYWKSLVQVSVKAGEPEIHPSTSYNGWTIESGSGTFQVESQKGIALLITATGHGKVASVGPY